MNMVFKLEEETSITYADSRKYRESPCLNFNFKSQRTQWEEGTKAKYRKD